MIMNTKISTSVFILISLLRIGNGYVSVGPLKQCFIKSCLNNDEIKGFMNCYSKA